MVKHLRFHACFYVFFFSLFISASSCLYAQDDDPRRFSYQLGIKVDPMGTQGKLSKGKSGKKMEMKSYAQKDSSNKDVEEKVPKGAYAQAKSPESEKKQKKGK